MPHFFDTLSLIQAFGLIGIFIIIFAESGLFFGFFLPGDTLLFTAGLLASEGHFNIAILMLGSFICAVAGDSVGYAFGKKIGQKIFTRENSFFFNKKYIDRAEKFYRDRGKSSIILARFVPIVRTFTPIMAGVGNMKYGIFLKYNIIGGLIWTIGVSGLGFFLGKTIPNIDHYILPIIIAIIVISVLPTFFQYMKARKTADHH